MINEPTLKDKEKVIERLKPFWKIYWEKGNKFTKGLKHSEETKRKWSEIHKKIGAPWMRGKKFTKEEANLYDIKIGEVVDIDIIKLKQKKHARGIIYPQNITKKEASKLIEENKDAN